MLTTRITLASLTGLLAASLCCISPASAQAQSCGKLDFDGKNIKLGIDVPVSLPVAPATAACMSKVAMEVKQRPLIRSVTVEIYAPEKALVDKQSDAVGAELKKALVAGGLSAARVSVVSRLASDAGRGAGVRLTYRQRRAGRSLAKVVRVEGSAANGVMLKSLQTTSPGTSLHKFEYLQNEPNTHTVTVLPDKSQLRAAPSTLLRIEKVTLGKNFKREVEIRIVRGTVETSTTHEDGASFRLVTRSGTATVKGTKFRTHVADDGSTRIEVVDGQVSLGNDNGNVDIGAGYGAIVRPGAAPEATHKLLPGAVGQLPLRSLSPAPPALSWQPVAGADGGYVLEMASNAEFSKDVVTTPIPAGTTTYTPSANPAASKWFWRVQAVDAQGFIGMPSKIFTFEIGEPAAPAPAPGA